MKPFFAAVVLSASFAASSAYGQTFSSGSTGADGSLNLATACTQSVCYVQLPPSGILNYTTINVPSGRTLKFFRNLNNTPVILLAQGDVTIQGSVDVSATMTYFGQNPSRVPGPGGFYGGASGQPGFGPGAGSSTTKDAKWVGALSLVPIIGGSGGFGRADYGVEGTGGGGAIVIASSTSVTVPAGSSINANGGSAGYPTGFGSGGAIRLVANTVTVAGNLYAYAQSNQGHGVIRLEAPAGALAFTGYAAPDAVLSTINPQIVASAISSLSILSIGGYQVPAYSGQRLDTVDLLLPMQLPDPISVVVAASNIPLGTQVGIAFGTTNAGSVTPGTLSGSLGSSTATVQVSGLNRGSLAYLFVSATFGVSLGAASMNPPGPDQVAQVRVTAAPGAAPQFSFQRADGSTIDSRQLPAELLNYFRP